MTTLKDAAIRQALSYMESVGPMDMYPDDWRIVETLRAALAEPVDDTALLRQALKALVWEVGSEPALYAPQTYATIIALRERLGEGS